LQAYIDRSRLKLHQSRFIWLYFFNTTDIYWRGVVMRALNLAMVMGLALPLVGLGQAASLAAAQSVPSSASQASRLAQSAAKLADGVYLYGQTSEPNQLGQSYFVFEVTQGKVLGALYMPQSSFDCAHGSFQADQLALRVRDSYAQSASNYAIGLNRTAKVAATRDLPGILPVGLTGFQRVEQVGKDDLQLLKTCKATYQAKVW
jgi:hypothetical protein